MHRLTYTMKKITSLLIGCSLALGLAALAQQPTDTSSPAAGAGTSGTEATQPSGKAERGAGKQREHAGGRRANAESKADTNANGSNPDAANAGQQQGGNKAE